MASIECALPGYLGLVELRQCGRELVVEQPHGIENLAKGGGRSGPVSAPEREDAVVAEISHDRRIGDAIAGEVAGIKRGPGRRRDDLHELKDLHLIDRVWQRLHDGGYLPEQLGVRIHQAVAGRDSVIITAIEISEP